MDSGPSKQDWDAYQREIHWKHKSSCEGYLPGTVQDKLAIRQNVLVLEMKNEIVSVMQNMTFSQLLELKKQAERIKATK